MLPTVAGARTATLTRCPLQRRLRRLLRVLRQTRALCVMPLRAKYKVPSDSASRTRAMLAPLVAVCLPFALSAHAPARCFSLQLPDVLLEIFFYLPVRTDAVLYTLIILADLSVAVSFA